MSAKKEKAIGKTKGIITEFKEFISRGNVIDMAVGIIIGTAFTAIVSSLVNDIIMPLVGLLLGGVDFSTLTANGINYGMFIQKIIDFLIIAIVVFLMVKMINLLRRKKKAEEAEAAAEPVAEVPVDIQLLTEIRDLLKEQGSDKKAE